METFRSIFENLPAPQLSDIIDIALVAAVFYLLLPIIRSTGTVRIVVLVGVILGITAIAEAFELHMLHFLLSELFSIGLLAIVIIFQPEIRRMIDHMSKIKLKEFLVPGNKTTQEMVSVIEQTVRACEVMSREKVGALIVFARSTRLDEYLKTGTTVDAQVSDQLIRNIFFPKAALHDGAMIIKEGKLSAAGCVLPLSESNHISADLGTRHRAALGMSEATDAVVVVVSEETGAISVAVDGVLKRHLATQTLQKILQNELCPNSDQPEENIVLKLRQKIQKKDKEDDPNEK